MKIIRASSCQFFNFRQKDYVTFFFLYNILAIHHFSKCVTKGTKCSSKHTQNLLVLNIFRIIVEIVSKFVIITTSTSLQFILKSSPRQNILFYRKKMSINLFFNLFLPLFIVCFCVYSSLFKSKLFRS